MVERGKGSSARQSVSDRVENSIRRVIEREPLSDFECKEEEAGVVHLSGCVASRNAAMRCEIVAKLVPGVRVVINDLRVVTTHDP